MTVWTNLKLTAIACLWAGFTIALVAGSARALEVRVATEVAPGGDVYHLVEEFRKAVEGRETDITVKVFSGGALGTQRQLQEQIQLGTIEVVGTASDIVEMAPEFGIFDLPFLFQDRQHVYRAMDGELGRQLNEILVSNRNVRVLAFGEAGFRHITNKVRPITKPEDLQGLKIRTPSAKLRIAAFNALGAAATPIPYSELYSALQQGVVDGQENPFTTIKEQSLWEVQKYVSLTYHVFTPAYLVVNETWWNGLSEEHRRTLTEAAREATENQRSLLAGQEESLRNEIVEKGMEINEPDLAPFVERTRVVWDEFQAAHGTTLIETVDRAR